MLYPTPVHEIRDVNPCIQPFGVAVRHKPRVGQFPAESVGDGDDDGAGGLGLGRGGGGGAGGGRVGDVAVQTVEFGLVSGDGGIVDEGSRICSRDRTL